MLGFISLIFKRGHSKREANREAESEFSTMKNWCLFLLFDVDCQEEEVFKELCLLWER